jgi:hypothetical protein
MSFPSDIVKSLTAAGPIAEALAALAPQIGDMTKHLPLIGTVADYIDGGDGIVPPDLPSQLRSDIEVRRMRVLAAKAEGAPPAEPEPRPDIPKP